MLLFAEGLLNARVGSIPNGADLVVELFLVFCSSYIKPRSDPLFETLSIYFPFSSIKPQKQQYFVQSSKLKKPSDFWNFKAQKQYREIQNLSPCIPKPNKPIRRPCSSKNYLLFSHPS